MAEITLHAFAEVVARSRAMQLRRMQGLRRLGFSHAGEVECDGHRFVWFRLSAAP